MQIRDWEYGKRLLLIAIKKQNIEHDSCFLCSGLEGAGKSTLVLDYYEEYCKQRNKIETINNVAFSLKELVNGLRDAQKKEFLSLDEGSELSSDRQFEGISKGIKRAFTVMRAKCLITFLCFTNPLRLNTYFKEDRVKGMFFIRKRGIAYFYNQKTIINKILPAIKKLDIKSINVFSQFKPDLCFRFPKYEGILLKDYNKKKADNINLVLEDLADEFGSMEKMIGASKACTLLHITYENFKKLLDEGLIPYTWNATHTKLLIKQSDVKLFMENNQIRDKSDNNGQGAHSQAKGGGGNT